jgi:N-acyl amino acid synthase of PEP-CTERM/exosortase system
MFDKRYEVILADTAEARKIHYQLRYQVYCLEEGFEAHERFPDRMERDQWDENSVHFIVRSKQSKEWIAAMRLVLPRHEHLPMESLCEIDSRVMPSNYDENIAEISRICVKDTFRRKRQPAAENADGSVARPAADEKATAGRQRYRKSEIMLGLLRAASVYSREHNISNWYFLTTPALARLINQMNVQLIKIGAACLHRGKRFPFMADLRESEKRLSRGCPVVEKMLGRSELAYRTFSELQPGYDSLAA